jgi:hypothetical protein
MRSFRDPAAAWGVQRLRLLLVAALVGALGVVTGVAMLIAQSVRPTQIVGDGAPPGGGFGALSPASVRDRIAAAPMASVDAAAATRPDPATELAPAIFIPEPSVARGPAGIPVFGHTAEGAVAQLAAIDTSVLEAMSVPQAREVHEAWVQPGGPTFEDWDLTQNVTAFLRGARQGSTKDVTTTVRVSPAGGLVKGTDGPDWVLACVLLDVQATIQTSYRMGWANCQRMQWTGERWLIGAGTQPATAPSAWPESKAALAAGWLTWTPDEGTRR